MQQITPTYKKHILVCTNSKEGRPCCKNVKGEEIFFKLKSFVKENGYASLVWVTRTGCLGFCNDEGATVVVYPDKIWYPSLKEEELEEFIRTNISKG